MNEEEMLNRLLGLNQDRAHLGEIRMKRDWEIIRAILIRLEEAQSANSNLRAEDFPEFAPQEVAYNMRLLKDAACIDAQIKDSYIGDGAIALAIAKRLTNSGHDLLDAMRNDTVWSKIKRVAIEKGQDLSIELVLAIGKQLIASQFQ